MMPDGTINPGEMTSFNHYALGAVANFMHSTIGGIMLLEPGWKRLLISPRPGGTITSATVPHVSPYGTIECSWFIKEQELIVNVVVPPNTCARVVLPGVDVEIGSGKKLFVAKWEADVRWPPKPIYSSMTIPLIDEIA